jgi:hypothetical protein
MFLVYKHGLPQNLSTYFIETSRGLKLRNLYYLWTPIQHCEITYFWPIHIYFTAAASTLDLYTFIIHRSTNKSWLKPDGRVLSAECYTSLKCFNFFIWQGYTFFMEFTRTESTRTFEQCLVGRRGEGARTKQVRQLCIRPANPGHCIE